MTRKTGFVSALLVTVAAVHSPAAEGQQQGGDARNGGLRVFLECAAHGCDRTHIRTEVDFVSWMVDTRDSQVHLIITSEGTGSGQQFRLDFIGREDLVGKDDQLFFASSNTDTDDERIQGLTGVIGVGLARYSVMEGTGGPFTVGHPGASSAQLPDLPPGLQGEVEDPWDYWVFEVGGNVDYRSEESENTRSLRGDFSANRTTELWKISLGGRGSLSRKEINLTDSNVIDERDDWNVDGRVFYSLAERWSVGLEAGANSSTRNNTELGAQVGTGVEYSFFPYRDWTRARMTLQALVYARYYDYDYITIYDQETETLWESSLKWNLGFRQPWGTASFNATAEAFLHDPSTFYRLSAGGRLSVRILRGLNWNIDGNVSKVRDQIYLSSEELNDEEILLQRRQLPTDYTFRVSTGFSFTFGSIFNNVVNNRFGSTGGGGRRF
jgi:hypothetical protein